MSELARPVLVERRKGERRKVGIGAEVVGADVSGFVEHCRAEGTSVQIQTTRELITGKIVAEDASSILVRTSTQDVLLFRRGVVSVATAKRVQP